MIIIRSHPTSASLGSTTGYIIAVPETLRERLALWLRTDYRSHKILLGSTNAYIKYIYWDK